MLNNRELATAIWAFALVGWRLCHKSVRHSAWAVITSALNPKIAVPFGITICYAGLLVVGLQRIGLWTTSLVKDTIFWLLFTGTATAFGLINSWKGGSVLRHLAADGLTVAIVVEFLTGTYTLSLPAELVLVPALAMLGAMTALAESRPEHAALKSSLEWTVVLLSLFVVGAAVRDAIADWQSLRSVEALRSFVIAPVLSLLFVPFVYGLLLYSTYENLFVRIHLATRNEQGIRAYARRRLVRTFGFRLSALRQFSNEHGRHLWSVRSKADFDAMLKGAYPPADDPARAV